MQGLGLMFALEPWLRRCWGAAEGRRALLRHDGYFNTNPFMAPLVVGTACALEEAASQQRGETREAALKRMGALKAAAAQSLAGVGDALFWGALRPLTAALGLLALVAGMLASGPRLGARGMAAIALCGFAGPTLWWRWKSLSLGYEWRERLALKLKDVPWQALIRRARYAGAALTAVLAVVWLAQGRALPGTLALGLYLLAFRLPAATPARLYAATCALGVLAAAAGWTR